MGGIERRDISRHSFLGRKPAFTSGQGFVYPFGTRTDSAAGAAGRCRKTERKRNNETHGTRRTQPHRVHARLRRERGGHRQGAREVGVDHLARAAQPQDRQRQALRVLEQAVRALRRMRADGLQRLQGRPAEELAGVLRVVPGLPRGRVRPPEQGPLRLQRMRARAQLPDAQALLHRLRRR